MTELTIRILLSILVILTGLVVGLLLRRLLVSRLKKTVLDDWLTQTLGFILVLLLLLVALAGSWSIIAITGLSQLENFWESLNKSTDLGGFVRNLLLSLLIIIFALGVARTLARVTMRGLGDHLALNLRIVINRVWYMLAMVIAAFWILSLWQVAIELPAAVLGTLTIAITFSIQDIVKDLVAGLYLLVERPFFIGDQISVDKYTGKVEAVELRATRLRLVSGEEVTIPNALVFGGVVINNSRYAERRATVLITMPLTEFSREETPARILATLQENEEIIPKPEPGVTVSGIADEKVELTLRFWIAAGQLASVTDVVYALRTLLPHANLAVKETAGDI